MRTRHLLHVVAFVSVLCLHVSGNHLPTVRASLMAAEPLAQIQAILVNKVPAGALTLDQIKIKRAATGTLEAGRVGMELFKDDELTTGAGVEASVLFTKPDSEDYVEVLMQENTHAKVGSWWIYVGKCLITGWGAFDTQTQNVRAGKKTTDFYMEVAPDGTVDLKVLRGSVELETYNRAEPTGQTPAGDTQRPAQPAPTPPIFTVKEKRTIGNLRGIKIKPGQLLPTDRPLENTEVETILKKTDQLMLASLAETTPRNVISTSFEPEVGWMADLQRIKIEANAAFTRARREATLHPTAENVKTLADAYKDLGAGKKSIKEYDHAARLKPEFQDSIEFLASQSEAYRIAGNLKKAAEKSSEAVRKSEQPGTDPALKQLALNARGNLSYDIAVRYVAAGNWETAGNFFRASKVSYVAANTEAASDFYEFITERNLLNATLAIGPDSTITEPPAELKGLMGTYRGIIDFPGAGIKGSAVLVISGYRFSLIHCDDSFGGSMIPHTDLMGGRVFDFVFDKSMAIKKLTLNVELVSEKRINLTRAPQERNQFSFSTPLKREPLSCLNFTGLR